MKKKSTFYVLGFLTMLCIPLGKILIDTNKYSFPNGVNADLPPYTVSLDATNTPNFLNSTPSGASQEDTPSRYVSWQYGANAINYVGAHVAFQSADENTGYLNLLTVNCFTNLTELIIVWDTEGDFNSIGLFIDNIPGGINPANKIDLNGETSPLTLSSGDFFGCEPSAYLRFYIYAGSTATFVLYSLQATYSC